MRESLGKDVRMCLYMGRFLLFFRHFENMGNGCRVDNEKMRLQFLFEANLNIWMVAM